MAAAAAPILAAGAPLPLTGEDALRLNVINGGVTTDVVTSGRYIIPGDPTIHAFENRVTVPATRLEVTQTTQVGAVSLLNVHIRTSKAAVAPGQLFVRLEIVRGQGTEMVLAILAAGYIGSWGGASWPGTPLRGPYDGAGNIRAVPDNSFTAGTERSVFLPVRTRWRVIAVAGVLSTSGVAGTRRPSLRFRDNGTVAWIGPSSLGLGPATATVFSWGGGMNWMADPGGGLGLGAFPTDMVLTTGDAQDSAIDTLTGGMDAGDLWSPFTVLVEEWLNPTTKFS